jgi:metallo-beta-lactamase family protein
MKNITFLGATGIVTGSRLLFHLNACATDPRNTILFTGYQAEGTRGADIFSGPEYIKAHSHMIPIHTQIQTIRSASVHEIETEFACSGIIPHYEQTEQLS